MMYRLRAVWLLLAAVMLLAAVSRLADLDRRPLDPAEAETALSAARAASVGSPFFEPSGVGPGPAYTLPTGVLFQWLGTSVTGARLVPALAGILLVLLPGLLAGRLGWPLALAWSALLAISTTALVASRAADAAILAAAGVGLWLIAALRQDRGGAGWLAGIGLGLAVAAGHPLWMGVFGLGLTALLVWLSGLRRSDHQPFDLDLLWTLRHRRVWLIGAGLLAAIILLGGLYLEGLAAVIGGPGAWLQGWLRPDGLALLPALLLLPAYEPLLLVGGLLGWLAARGSEARVVRLAGWWALGALMAFLLYPARQPLDLIWLALPLALLTGYLIVGWLEALLGAASPLTILLLGGFLLTVSTFAYFQLEAATAGFGLATMDRQILLGYGLAALGFSVVLVFLFGLGWSWRETLLAVELAAIVSLLGLNVSAAAGLELEQANVELWRPRRSTANLRLLESSITATANAYQGASIGLPVEVRGDASPEIAWALRHQRLAASSAEAARPPVVLAPESSQPPALPADYLGQGFATVEGWAVAGQLPDDLVTWWLDRRGASLQVRWIMYVRMDVATLGEAPAVGEPEGGEG